MGFLAPEYGSVALNLFPKLFRELVFVSSGADVGRPQGATAPASAFTRYGERASCPRRNGGRPTALRSRRRVGPSQTELSKPLVIQAEVVPDLVTHGLRDLGLQLLGVLAEVADQRVAENHYLVGHATAAEEAPAARLEADVLAVGVVLGAAIGDHNRDVPQRVLKLLRQFVERRADESLEFLLARVPLADLGPP